MQIRLLVILMLFPLCLTAQKSLEIGLGLGLTSYEGDLAPLSIATYIELLQPAGGIFVRKNFGDNFALRLDARRSKIVGADSLNNRSRDLHFQTVFTTVALSAEVSLFKLQLKGDDLFLMPYGNVGVGVIQFTPQAEINGRLTDLQPLGTEGQGLPGYAEPYETSKLQVSAGGGLKLNINRRWTIAGEAILILAFTDYLDDVSGTLINYQDILEGKGENIAQLSRPETTSGADATDFNYRRGGVAEDYIVTGGVTISYHFGGGNGRDRLRGISCPSNF